MAVGGWKGEMERDYGNKGAEEGEAREEIIKTK